MRSPTLDFVLNNPNKAADHIDELEKRLWLSVDDAKQAADRIAALEAALHKIDDITIDHTAMGIARKALARAKATPAPEQDK
jgi:hypothetical protein